MSKYNNLKNKILSTGKIIPNSEAKARVERQVKQHNLLIKTKETLGSIPKKPSYTERFLNTFDSLINEATKREKANKLRITEPTFSVS